MMHPAPFFMLGLIPLSFFLVLVLTDVAQRLWLNRMALDLPNHRSLHKSPVPRGAGIIILAVLVPALIAASVFLDAGVKHAGFIFGIVLTAAISWIDDRHHVNPALRLAFHLTAACVGVLSFSPQEMVFGGVLPLGLDRALTILGWTWFINLYNFMDGIDGITAVETIAIAIGLYLCLAMGHIGDPFLGILALALIGASFGFLAHNWHPAKIFLGDVGSVPLGYIVGFGLLTIAVNGHPAAAIILPLYYLLDSGVTIVRRGLRGEPVWQAHREHFYQKAALAKKDHRPVVVYIAIADMGLIVAALLSFGSALAGLALALAIVAILLWKMHKAAIHRTFAPKTGRLNEGSKL